MPVVLYKVTDITSDIGLAKTFYVEFCMAKPLAIIEIYIHDPRTRVESSYRVG